MVVILEILHVVLMVVTLLFLVESLSQQSVVVEVVWDLMLNTVRVLMVVPVVEVVVVPMREEMEHQDKVMMVHKDITVVMAVVVVVQEEQLLQHWQV
jgi:hypothetical protein